MFGTRTGVQTIAALITIVALASSPLRSQTAHATLSGFEPNNDYVLVVDGEVDAAAQILLSRRAAAFLLRSATLASPLLLWARTQRVDSIAAEDVLERDDGRVDLVDRVRRSYLGELTQDDLELRLPAVDGRDLRLRPKEALVGVHSADALVDHSPDYAAAMNAYRPSDETIEQLLAIDRPVTVRVFFGTWCAVCKGYLPNLMRVQLELEGSPIEFEYFGLDYPPAGWEAPEVEAAEVSGLPTAILMQGGQEIGRFKGAKEFAAPEASLLAQLRAAP